jgi:hypothetical protein
MVEKMSLNFHSNPPEMKARHLDTLRQTYEIQAQTFSHWHDEIVKVILFICFILVLLGDWWLCGYVLLIGFLIVYILKRRILTVKRNISKIDIEMRELCIEFLPKNKR